MAARQLLAGRARQMLVVCRNSSYDYPKVVQAFDAFAEWLGFANGRILLSLLNRAYLHDKSERAHNNSNPWKCDGCKDSQGLAV